MSRTRSDFRAFQNLVCEHSIEGVQASLYNLTKCVPDPCIEVPQSDRRMSVFSHKLLAGISVFSLHESMENAEWFSL